MVCLFTFKDTREIFSQNKWKFILALLLSFLIQYLLGKDYLGHLSLLIQFTATYVITRFMMESIIEYKGWNFLKLSQSDLHKEGINFLYSLSINLITNIIFVFFIGLSLLLSKVIITEISLPIFISFFIIPLFSYFIVLPFVNMLIYYHMIKGEGSFLDVFKIGLRKVKKNYWSHVLKLGIVTVIYFLIVFLEL